MGWLLKNGAQSFAAPDTTLCRFVHLDSEASESSHILELCQLDPQT